MSVVHSLAVVLLSFACAAASAAELTLNPTRVLLGPTQSSETLVLGNEEDRPISFEVEVKRWTQDADGSWRLQPDDGLIVHPLILTVPPKGRARLRVGTLQAQAPAPRAWRVELQQLPEARPQEGMAVQLLTRMSVPVFLQPNDARAQPVLQAPQVETGAVRMRLHNVGTAYLPPQDARLRVLDAAGKPLHETPIAPGYVLAGAQLPLSRPLPAGVCARAARLELTLQEPAATVSAAVPAAARRCGG